VVGGLLGAVFAVWAFRGLIAAALSALPLEMGTLLRIKPEPDLRVFGFAVAVSVLAGVGSGLTPALTAARPALRTTIEQASPGSGRRTRSRLQGTLVGAQVAFSMVLVVTTALLLRGLYQAQTVDPDFDHEELVVAVTDMQSFGYESERATLLQRQAIDGIRGLPGVENVAQARITPLEPAAWYVPYRVPEEAEFRGVQTNNVSANYFAVTGITIVRGREFTEAEVAAEQPSAVILTESTARSFWPDQEPIGRTLIALLPDIRETSVEVVGIARDVEVVSIAETDTAYLYLPAMPSSQPAMQLVVRTALPAESLGDGIKAVFERLDSQLPVTVRPLAQNFEYWTRLSGLAASLSFGLGALALVLASVGVFGVMSTVLARRMREIGIRLALGAGKADVLRLVLRKSMRPVALGAVVGALACFGVARLLAGLLFGVGALDPYALAGAAAAVFGAAFLASAIPARRAANVDPMTTLRYE
jgi:predicted permease